MSLWWIIMFKKLLFFPPFSIQKYLFCFGPDLLKVVLTNIQTTALFKKSSWIQKHEIFIHERITSVIRIINVVMVMACHYQRLSLSVKLPIISWKDTKGNTTPGRLNKEKKIMTSSQGDRTWEEQQQVSRKLFWKQTKTHTSQEREHLIWSNIKHTHFISIRLHQETNKSMSVIKRGHSIVSSRPAVDYHIEDNFIRDARLLLWQWGVEYHRCMCTVHRHTHTNTHHLHFTELWEYVNVSDMTAEKEESVQSK